MTDWIDILRARCAETSQARVADKIGYSPAVISTVLKGTYAGDLTAVEKAVRGAFMGATVDCPVLGAIASNRCLEEQRKPFAATNPHRVTLYRACRSGCAHSALGSDRQLKRPVQEGGE
jgi:hypothetical protein